MCPIAVGRLTEENLILTSIRKEDRRATLSASREHRQAESQGRHRHCRGCVQRSGSVEPHIEYTDIRRAKIPREALTAFNPDHDLLAVATKAPASELHIWDALTRQCKTSFAPIDFDKLSGLVWEPDFEPIVLGTNDRSLLLEV